MKQSALVPLRELRAHCERDSVLLLCNSRWLLLSAQFRGLPKYSAIHKKKPRVERLRAGAWRGLTQVAVLRNTTHRATRGCVHAVPCVTRSNWTHGQVWQDLRHAQIPTRLAAHLVQVAQATHLRLEQTLDVAERAAAGAINLTLSCCVCFCRRGRRAFVERA